MKYIIYSIFNQKYVNESIYSINSIIQTEDIYMKQISIIIYTNLQHELDQKLHNQNIIIEKIDEQERLKYMGENQFFFRFKIKLFQLFFEKYGNHPVLFLDTDTVIMNDLCPLFEKLESGNFIMYSKCTSIIEAVMKADTLQRKTMSQDTRSRIEFYRSILKDNHIIVNKSHYLIDKTASFYNSAVIGIGGMYSHIIEEIIDLCDYLYSKYRYCKTTGEEIAFSMVFQKYGEIFACNDTDIIYHYSEAKFCKYIVGNLLQCLQSDDHMMFKKILIDYDLECIEHYHLKLNELPVFMQYVLFCKNKAYEDLELNSLDEAYTYIDINTAYYKRNMNIKKYMKYMKIKRDYLKN